MLEKIRKVVCNYFEVPEDYIDVKTNKREVSEKRQICHYFSNEYRLKNKRETTLFKIGAYFGGKDHATVLHSHKHIKNLIDSDKTMRVQIAYMSKMLKYSNHKIQTRSIVKRLKKNYYLALSFKGLNAYQIAKLL